MIKKRLHHSRLHPKIKPVEVAPVVAPANPPRKRGRPRKVDVIRDEILDMNSSKGYTASEEEALKTFYKKAFDLFKIHTSKALMARMRDVQQYIYHSREFGLLSLPFPPYKKHIED